MKSSIKRALSLLLTIALLASLVIVPTAAAAGELTSGTYYLSSYDHQGKKVADVEGASVTADTDIPGVTFDSKFTDHNDSGHGPHCSAGGQMIVDVPTRKYATLVVTICGFSTDGYEVTSSSGKVSSKALKGCSGKGSEVTITNATGETTVTFDKQQVYIHGLTVALSDEPVVVAPAVVAEGEVIGKVGEVTTMDVALENAEDKTVTWEYAVSADADATIVGRINSPEAGKVSFTGAKAGKTKITLKATVDDEPYTKDVTVYVQPDPVGVLDEAKTQYIFDGKHNVDGKVDYYCASGIKWTGIAANSDGHGAKGNGSMTLYVPQGKKANIVLHGCEYGTALDATKVTSTSGTVTEGTPAGCDNGKGPAVNVTGATGNVTITLGGNCYIHTMDVELVAENTPTMSVSTTSVSMRAGETKDVTVTAENYAEGMKPFAVSASEEIATVAVKDNTVTVTGVSEGATNVYVVMDDAQPTLAEAVADKDAKVVAVTVSAALPEGTKVYDFRKITTDGMAAMTEVKFEQGTASQPSKPHNSDYGLYFFPGNQIGVPVDGPSKITVKLGNSWHIGVGTKQNGAQYGETDLVASKGGAAANQSRTLIYTGGPGYAYVTALSGCTSYPSEIMVEPYKDITLDQVNKVDVWDFSAEALDEALFVNKLTVDAINDFYPAELGYERGGVNSKYTIPSFKTTDGELAFNDGGFSAAHRLRTDNTAITRRDAQTKRGAEGADPYAATELVKDEQDKVVGGETYHGLIYSNKSGDPNVNMVVKAKAGDKLTYVVSSNGNAADYTLTDATGAVVGMQKYPGTQGSINAVPMTFFAPADGDYTIAVTVASDGSKEKLVVCRIYRESGVKVAVSGTVTAPANIPKDYSLVFTGPGGVETTTKVGADGKYTVQLNNYLSGADYIVTLKDADGFVVGGDDTLTLDITDRAATKDVEVAAVDLVKVTGKVAGLSEADLANLVLTVNKPETEIYAPKIVPAADGSFTASFARGVKYTLTADFVNDYDLVKTDLSYTADTTENIVFSAKPTYAVTMASDPADVDLSKAAITFVNVNDTDDKHLEGYTYTFTGTEGIKLRDGQYKVKVEGVAAVQKLTPDFVVDGADNTCTVPFSIELPTVWDFSAADFVDGVYDQAGDKVYNQLKIGDGLKKETGKKHVVGAAGTIQVPVAGPCDVVVSYYYAAKGTIGGTPFETASGSTSTIESTTYAYTGAAGFVDVVVTDKSYLTKIEVVTKTPFAATVTVGKDKDYKTINEALAAVAKMDRPNKERVTVVIDPGDYEEQLIVRSDNVTLKNANANAKLELTNKGVGIGANEVRITWYYGHGYDYYSMTTGGVYDPEVLAVNKANGYQSYANGGGNQGSTLWNSTVSIFANGFEADGIIFENSFNQYQSKKATEDVMVAQPGNAHEGAVPRAEMKAGDTTVQQKAYVERAAAVGIGNNYGQASFNNCAFIGRQDVLFGGTGTTAAFYACDLYGGTDYIMGPMTAAFAKCNLIMNTSEDNNDVSYLTAPQQAADARGYLFYNCTVTSTEPGVNTASAHRSKPGTFGRPWSTEGEAVFYKTNVEATDPVYYGEDVTSTSLIQPAGWTNGLGGFAAKTRMGEQDTVEYYEGVDNTQARTKAGMGKIYTTGKTDGENGVAFDPLVWFGETTWKPFEGKDLTIVMQTPKAFSAEVLKDELEKAITKANGVYDVAPDTKAEGTAVADVDRGTEYVYESDKAALKAAIDAAQAVVDNNAATANDVFAAQKALAAAVSKFEKATKTGTKAPNTTALAAAIKAAEDKMAGVVTSEGPADKVAKDVKFASKAAMDAIKADLDAAKTALNSTTNNQADVDKATTDLTGATDKFVPQVGTKAADPASLKKAIEDATAAKKDVVVNAGPADQVDSGVKFVTSQAVIDKLDKAIADAQKIADKTNPTQAELDKALKDLTIATTDFNASVQTGTKGGEQPGPDTVNKTALEDAIKAAKDVYAIGADVEVMPAGTKTGDVAKGDKFVTQDVYDALGDAIAKADAVLKDPNATEKDVTDALAALKAAQDAFKVQEGTKTSGGSSHHGGGGGGSSSSTTTKSNNAGGKTTKKTNSSGTTYTVTDKSGEEIAKVTIPATIPSVGYKFVDVPDDHWAAKSINNIAGLGMVKGVDDVNHIYDMTSATSRAAVATILYRLSNGKEGINEAFADVEADQWYTDGIAWAAKVGIVTGYSAETFAPNDPVTREQLAVMLYRYAGLLALDTAKKGDVSDFTDASAIDEWATEAMTWAVGVGILQGDENKALNPTDNASRAETACMLDRFVALLK